MDRYRYIYIYIANSVSNSCCCCSEHLFAAEVYGAAGDNRGYVARIDSFSLCSYECE